MLERMINLATIQLKNTELVYSIDDDNTEEYKIAAALRNRAYILLKELINDDYRASLSNLIDIENKNIQTIVMQAFQSAFNASGSALKQ